MQSKKVKIDNILLDPNNFRLHGHSRYKFVEPKDYKNVMVQKRTHTMILEGDRREGINDLIDSFKSNGILKIDNILVRPLSDGFYLVIEGNRRVATLKALLDDYEKGFDVGNLDPDFLNSTDKEIDVVEYPMDSDDSESYLLLMGLRHVTKVKDWGDFEQSELVHELNTKFNLSFADISDRLGIRGGITEVRRRVNAFVVMQIYKKSEYGDQFSSKLAPIFYEVMGAPNIREWLGWSEDNKEFKNTFNLNRFLVWVSKTDENEPIIKGRDDIRTLKKIINDNEALIIMEESNSLVEAYEQSQSVTTEGVKKALSALKGNVDKITVAAINNMSATDKNKLQNIVNTIKAFEKLL